jgi:hypothetical protein
MSGALVREGHACKECQPQMAAAIHPSEEIVLRFMLSSGVTSHMASKNAMEHIERKG